MNIYNHFAARIAEAVRAAGLKATPEAMRRIVVEPPRDPAHGDLATNAAMVLAKPLRRAPREIASLIAEKLADDPDVARAQTAGPGFINLRLADAVWPRVLIAVLTQGNDYGRSAHGGRRVNVEYVSANPTGPLHVGHVRGAVFGDALANLLAFTGNAVTREYYINDAGGQIDVLARSVYLRAREALGEDIGAIPPGLYPGAYLKPVGARVARDFGHALLTMPENEWLPAIRLVAIDAMMHLIREDLSRLGIHHDVFFSERDLHARPDGVAALIDELRARNLVYEGRLPPPKGQVPEDWEDRPQTLFRSSDFGDDIDRPLVKSDGSFTYFAADGVYLRDKFQRGFQDMIYVLGADHGGYVKRLEAVGEAVSAGAARVVVLVAQLVKLWRGGAPVRMSKRSGDFGTLRALIDEVGPDPIRFMMLFRKNDAPLDFDFEKVTEQSKDNPVFYVQYAYARTQSVARQAATETPRLDCTPETLAAALDLLRDRGERELIARLAQWPRAVEAAAEAYEPHRLAFYLYELASAFHAHWNRGKELPQLRFINIDRPQETQARLALVKAISVVLANGLRILGVTAPSDMR